MLARNGEGTSRLAASTLRSRPVPGRSSRRGAAQLSAAHATHTAGLARGLRRRALAFVHPSGTITPWIDGLAPCQRCSLLAVLYCQTRQLTRRNAGANLKLRRALLTRHRERVCTKFSTRLLSALACCRSKVKNLSWKVCVQSHQHCGHS